MKDEKCRGARSLSEAEALQAGGRPGLILFLIFSVRFSNFRLEYCIMSYSFIDRTFCFLLWSDSVMCNTFASSRTRRAAGNHRNRPDSEVLDVCEIFSARLGCTLCLNLASNSIALKKKTKGTVF